jgi:Uma2 family endonuclease
MTSIADRIYSVVEYFELEKNSEIRHEYYYGKLIEMPGESKIANRIANNILSEWRKPLLEKKFECYTHDVKSEINRNNIYRYPDLVVAPDSDDDDDYVIKQPIIMVEVASEQSWRTDSGKKRKEYTGLASMQYYLIVSQEEMFVELCMRDKGTWSFAFFESKEDVIELPLLGLSISLENIYDRVKFGEAKTDILPPQ